jgi:hypothetical protein
MFKETIIKISYAGFIFLVLSACEDNLIQRNSPIVDGKVFEGTGRDAPGDYKQTSGDNYPYPEIIRQEFIPTLPEFSHAKCISWRITWPWYDADDGSDMMPPPGRGRQMH